MGPMIPNVGEGLFPDTPKGRELPIGCTYPFSGGVEIMLTSGITPALYSAPLPEGWRAVPIPSDDPEVRKAGFDPGMVWVNAKTGERSFVEREGFTLAGYTYLRNAEGELVATWDEGRWWTPEESKAFHLMIMVPGAKDAYGIGQDTPKGGIEWTDQDQ